MQSYLDRDAADDDRTVVETIERRDPVVGSVLDGRFRLDLRIAAGGFGAIYRGTDLVSNAELAVKVLHREMATDASIVARFRREGATLSQLHDPHTVNAYAVGETADGTLYIVMELLGGESLYERYRAGGPLPWKRVVAIARAVCSSVAEAHALGIVHRDLKPANIHLERRGDDADYVKVVDFGIAKVLAPSDAQLTQAGQMIGTFDYMSPEQMIGGHCTGASDIYTLGVVIYEMICGRRPFGDCNGPTSLLAEMLTKQPLRLASRAIVPLELDDVVMRCLEREPHHRWTDMRALAEALDRFVGDLPAPLPAPAAFVTLPLQLDVRGSRPVMIPDGNGSPMAANGTWWEVPPAPRASSFDRRDLRPASSAAEGRCGSIEIPRFDMTGAQTRDDAVRAVVWACVVIFGIIIAALVASHL